MNKVFSIITASLMLFGALLLKSAGCIAASTNDVVVDNFRGREILVHVPQRLPPPGSRALVIVLHGGLGNARRIESGQSEHGLKMDSVADEQGFIVAYLNGTPVTKRFGDDKLGWNAGGCCGQSSANNIDDVGYIEGAVSFLANKYGVDTKQVFGIGHSNGAMMTERLICETNLYAAAVSVSGPLMLAVEHCPAAKGKRILAIHGALDKNVPVTGGRGTKGLSNAVFTSEEHSRQIFEKSGASFELQIVANADHQFDHIDDAIRKTENQSLAEKAAKYFGLNSFKAK